ELIFGINEPIPGPLRQPFGFGLIYRERVCARITDTKDPGEVNPWERHGLATAENVLQKRSRLGAARGRDYFAGIFELGLRRLRIRLLSLSTAIGCRWHSRCRPVPGVD